MDIPTVKPASPNLQRTLTLFDAVGIVVCAMIGSGIFIVSSQAATELQSGSLLLLAWLVSGIMTIIGSLAFAELAAGCPEVGGQYAYIKNAWGDLPAFLYGWTLSFVIKSGSIAAVALGFAKFAAILLPAISTVQIQFGPVFLSSQKLLATALILALTAINILGVKIVARIQNVVTITNWLALVLIILAGTVFSLNPATFISNMHPLPWLANWDLPLFCTLGIALVGPLFALDGWNNVTFIAAEIKKPVKNLPLALILGAGLTTVLYLLVNGVYLAGLSLSAIMGAKNGVVGAALMRSAMGPFGERLITAIILVAAFGCVNSMILSGSRAIYALARDGHFFKRAAQLGGRSNVPETALWLQAGWSVFLVLSRAFSDLLDYMVFASLLFYGLTVAGLFILRKRQPKLRPVYRVGGYPLLPLAYCLLCLWIMGSLLYLRPISAGISLVIVLLGIPPYFALVQRKGDNSPLRPEQGQERLEIEPGAL